MPVKVIVERPLIKEKVVDVQVLTIEEKPEYEYKERKVSTPFDVVIKRKIEYVKEVPVEVRVTKEIVVPTKVLTQNPVEDMKHFEQDIDFQTTEYTTKEVESRNNKTFNYTSEELNQLIMQLKQ